jgi:hypothetical protein
VEDLPFGEVDNLVNMIHAVIIEPAPGPGDLDMRAYYL